jgi:hypothetical protein
VTVAFAGDRLMTKSPGFAPAEGTPAPQPAARRFGADLDAFAEIRDVLGVQP